MKKLPPNTFLIKRIIFLLIILQVPTIGSGQTSRTGTTLRDKNFKIPNGAFDLREKALVSLFIDQNGSIIESKINTTFGVLEFQKVKESGFISFQNFAEVISYIEFCRYKIDQQYFIDKLASSDSSDLADPNKQLTGYLYHIFISPTLRSGGIDANVGIAVVKN